MILHPELKPKLRPVEPGRGAQPGTLTIGDPSRLSPNTISLTEPAFFILTLLDGEHTLTDVQQNFEQRYGQPLAFDTLAQMVTHLEESLLLEGPGFEAHYRKLVERYRAAPARTMNGADALGVDGQAGDMFRDMLGDASQADCNGRIVGLIAPHLDYPRGRPCYAEAYAALGNQPPPDRVVILGTNHFGLGGRSSVVATGMDFATPLGTTATDRAFLERLEADCGDLRRYEYDHANEHSIELQVCWLQHLFGAEAFKMVGLLCPDPCGPTGTAPQDGQGVDLGEFAAAL
ncbi:MAG: AmmeMemoRadiSam system protein B, partial [Planctomycetes bacterium]|nr:AmmeMemoRadiSam system protein B [Planctomycetota bacterium]